MLRGAACEKLFAVGACDSHAPVGPAPPTPRHRRSAKSVTLDPRNDLLLWALWVTIDKHHRRRRSTGAHLICGRCGSCKMQSDFNFSLDDPNDPQNLGAKNVAVGCGRCGSFG